MFRIAFESLDFTFSCLRVNSFQNDIWSLQNFTGGISRTFHALRAFRAPDGTAAFVQERSFDCHFIRCRNALCTDVVPAQRMFGMENSCDAQSIGNAIVFVGIASGNHVQIAKCATLDWFVKQSPSCHLSLSTALLWSN